MSNSAPVGVYRFADCELDAYRFELRRGGEVQRIEPQVFEVLAHLVAHRDRLVTKEELLDEVWGDRFVSESALTSRLKAARAAIGDSGSSQHLIRTVHGRGYHFVGEVTEVAPAGPGSAPPSAPSGRLLGPPPGVRVRYVRSGGASIAYQVIGEGPVDVVMIPGFVSNVELAWELPAFNRFLTDMGEWCRLVVFDKRGTGLSDPVGPDAVPTLEERIDDVRAVLDDAGIERAAVFGVSEGGAMAMTFAATHPERVSRLATFGSYAHLDEHPRRSEFSWFLEQIRTCWGDGDVFGYLAPSYLALPGGRELLGRYERHAASPENAARIMELSMDIDVRALLPSFDVPTLVLARNGDAFVPAPVSAEVAALVPGAEMRVLPGTDHWLPCDDGGLVCRELRGFFGADTPSRPARRVVSTVMFADIVDSTATALEMGDRRWTAVLDGFRHASEQAVAEHDGDLIRHLGDGFLACFDGPARAGRAALAVSAAAARAGLSVRCGVHTAEIERSEDDVAGVGVHVGARIGALAAPGEVWASRTVRDLVAGSGLRFEERGSHHLRGLEGEWELFALAT